MAMQPVTWRQMMDSLQKQQLNTQQLEPQQKDLMVSKSDFQQLFEDPNYFNLGAAGPTGIKVQTNSNIPKGTAIMTNIGYDEPMQVNVTNGALRTTIENIPVKPKSHIYLKNTDGMELLIRVDHIVTVEQDDMDEDEYTVYMDGEFENHTIDRDNFKKLVKALS